MGDVYLVVTSVGQSADCSRVSGRQDAHIDSGYDEYIMVYSIICAFAVYFVENTGCVLCVL